MSTIGSSTATGLGLAGSIVGSSRPEAATDRSKAAAAEQDARINVLSKTPGDVADPEFGSDRDADGRMLYRGASQPPGPAGEEAGPTPERTAPRPVDAFGDRGSALDVEA